MFPDEIINQTEVTTSAFNGRAYLYDYEKQEFPLKNGAPILLTGKDALKAWIEKCIRTVKFKAAVHQDLDYGVNIEDLIGSVFDRDFVRAEIEREVTEALLKNEYIIRIDSFVFDFTDDRMSTNITLSTVYDDEKLEVSM